MVKISLIKDFDTGSSYWDRDEIVLVTLQISEEAADSFGEGIIPEQLYIITSDLDRIYLSRNPDATLETEADFIIRTWDIYSEDDSEYITINWTFHVMGESSDHLGTSSHEHCDGRSDIRLDGFAQFRLAIYNGITDIHIPEGVTEIGYEAFYDCSGMTEIHIPESVTEIGDEAFCYCSGLTEIFIPESVEQIGNCAFDYCEQLNSITVSPRNKIYDSREDCNAIIHTESNSLIAGCMSTVIPDSVTEIGSGAFFGCTGLKVIHIPEGVTKIGSCAFRGCTGLTEIHIPNGVNEIGSGAFEGCAGLKEIHIPNGVAEIGSGTFKGCAGLTEIHIPDGVAEIGSGTFKGCAGLTEIHIPDGVDEIGNGAFEGCTGLKEIHIPNGVAEIGSGAFMGCTGLPEIQIPDSVTKIGNRAFAGCTRLAEINIPEGVTEIGDNAFEGCTGLTEIQIPDSVTKIGNRAFEGCTRLTEIHIPEGVTEIGSGAFMGCTGLAEVHIPNGVSKIDASTFCDCSELSKIHIPNSVTEIANWAFNGCSRLAEFYIPESVMRIGDRAFAGCTRLTEIHIPECVTEIGRMAFYGCKGLTELTVSPGNTVYDSRDNSNAIIETDTGKLIADCRNTVFTDSWLETLSKKYGSNDESDDEIKTMAIIKNIFQDTWLLTELSDYVKKYIEAKFRHEWYKNYIGTRKLSFDGPTNYTEEGIISDEDISNMMCGNWDDFLSYRLKVGHTERQDRFTSFMRDYPMEILDWLGEDTIPYYFYEGLAKGGDYELYGCSKEEFINILSDKNPYEQNEPFEYAVVLEEKYGIDYAVNYLIALNWYSCYLEGLSDGSMDFVVQMFSKAVSLGDNAEALKAMGYLSINRDDGKLCLDFSIEMYSRLAAMWKKGLIDDDWLTDVDYYGGLAYVFDWEWGDDMWDEDSYPEKPDENSYRLWLLKLLESDFADDIVDYLKPLLEQVLERERNHNWETGKKTIESFLAKTSNK